MRDVVNLVQRGLSFARRRPVILLLGVMAPVIVAADSCPSWEEQRAIRKVVEEHLEEILGNIAVNERLRVHLYPEPIRPGSEVRPYSLDEDTAQPRQGLTCEGDKDCRLFFVDSDHWAHFTHPTVVVLWDPGAEKPRRLRWVKGGWWPLVDDKPVFNTVRSREDWKDPNDPDPARTIVYPAWNAIVSYGGPRRPDVHVALRPNLQPSTFGYLFSLVPQIPYPVWAVLVAGYHDSSDTFDTDVAGMETVLRGLGVPADHLFVLSPKYGNPGPGPPGGATRLGATEANIQQVLTDDLISSIGNGSCAEFLFFMSSHGQVDQLQVEDGYVVSGDLKAWIDQVPCDKITVVLDGCKSGSFIDELKPVPTPQINSGNGSLFSQQERFLITSATDKSSSWRDKDEDGGDPDKNPGDIGSETMSGYIFAYGESAANVADPTNVTFDKAFEFAKFNDLSFMAGVNTPQFLASSNPDQIVHTCYYKMGSPKLEIKLKQEISTPPAETGELVRCRCNTFSATVSLGGGDPPPVSTVRFYWTNASDPAWDVNNQPDFKEIWDSTRLIGSHEEFPITIDIYWSVGKYVEAGDEITLLAVADSPYFPIPEKEDKLQDLLGHGNVDAIVLKAVNPTSCCLFPCGLKTVKCQPNPP